MMLYDFECDDCGKKFEDLVRELSDARCPACASAHVTKQLSTFAVGGRRGDPEPMPSGGCGGACGVAVG
jgi:putative FmdB family regulatory protein